MPLTTVVFLTEIAGVAAAAVPFFPKKSTMTLGAFSVGDGGQ